MLDFGGGDCSRGPPPSTTLENEHISSFSMVVAVRHHHQLPTALVFDDGHLQCALFFLKNLLCFTNLPSGEGWYPSHLISSIFDANREGLNNPLLFPPPPPSTAIKNEQARLFLRMVDRRKRLLFDSGGCSPPLAIKNK